VNKQNWPEFPLWWLDQSRRRELITGL